MQANQLDPSPRHVITRKDAMKLARLSTLVRLVTCVVLTTASIAAQAPPTAVGSTSAVQTAALTFTENATVASIKVLTQGAPNLDFKQASGGTCSVGSAYTQGQTCTVKYTFNPTHPGTRYGAVALYDNSSPANAAATTYLQGTGNGPQAVLSPPTGSVLSTGSCSAGPFCLPTGVAVDGLGNIFVSGGYLVEILAAGGYSEVRQLTTGGPGVAVDGADNVFFADGSAVKELVAADGYTTLRTIGSGFLTPQGVAVDGGGNLFVADEADNAVKEITAAGGYTTVKALCGCGGVYGVAVDGSGNVFGIAKAYVFEIVAAGGYTTVRGIASPTPGPRGEISPGGVAIDGEGNVFITVNDGSIGSWITEFVAKSGYTNGKIVATQPYELRGLVLDSSGNIFLAEYADSAVKKLDFGDPPNLSFAATAAGSTSTDSPQTVTVTNDGNQNLKFTGLSYPADFPEASGVTTDCMSSTTLGLESWCTLSIDFSPQRSSATGLSTPLSQQVSVTDNNLNVTNAALALAVSGTETFTAPALITPTPGTVIGSSSATFTWSPGNANTFQFRLGTTLGSNNIYGSGQTNATSETVSGLPTAVTIYARLYYMLDGAWKALDYTYPGTTTAPSLTIPTPGSTLSGSTVTFTWNPGTATTFQFRLGTTLGSNNIYGSGQTTKPLRRSPASPPTARPSTRVSTTWSMAPGITPTTPTPRSNHHSIREITH